MPYKGKLSPETTRPSSNSKQQQWEKKRALASEPDHKSPIYILLFVQLLFFVIQQGLVIHSASSLSAPPFGLSLRNPQWWQGLTSGFAFVSWRHLSETLFITYVCGRLVERAHRSLGIWLVYMSAVTGANLLALLLLPAKAYLSPSAATAGALGLFIAGLALPRMIRKPLEVLFLSPLVCFLGSESYATFTSLWSLQGIKAGHLVHPIGAALGAAVAWLILSLRAWRQELRLRQEEEEEEEARRREKVEEDRMRDDAIKSFAIKTARKIL